MILTWNVFKNQIDQCSGRSPELRWSYRLQLLMSVAVVLPENAGLVIRRRSFQALPTQNSWSSSPLCPSFYGFLHFFLVLFLTTIFFSFVHFLLSVYIPFFSFYLILSSHLSCSLPVSTTVLVISFLAPFFFLLFPSSSFLYFLKSFHRLTLALQRQTEH